MIIFDYIVKEFADAVLMKASLPVTQPVSSFKTILIARAGAAVADANL